MAQSKELKGKITLTPKPKGKIILTPKFGLQPKPRVPFNKAKYTA